MRPYKDVARFCQAVLDRREGQEITDVPRALFICGTHMSGKTCLTKAIHHILDEGKPLMRLSSFDKPSVLSLMKRQDVIYFDNLPKVGGTMADFIAECLTVGTVSFRILHSEDVGMQDTSNNHFVINGLFNYLTPYLASRVMVVEMGCPMPGDRLPEEMTIIGMHREIRGFMQDDPGPIKPLDNPVP